MIPHPAEGAQMARGRVFGLPSVRGADTPGKRTQEPVLALRRGDFQDASASAPQDAFGSRQAVKLASLGAGA